MTVQVSMKLEVRDSPGQLVAALMPISDMGGNIRTVIHERDQTAGKGVLSVEVVIDIPQERLENLIRLFHDRDINVLKIGEERFSYKKVVILIGHLVHTNLGDTIDRIDSTGFAEVTDMNLAMPAIDEPTSAQFVIKSVTRDDMDHAIGILREVTAQKKILLIEPLEI